ncbi:MAG: cold-shock protein [Alphaproteobacteria bacterium]|nr:cold-shock protein [Alphaproteobacteria bacterium]
MTIGTVKWFSLRRGYGFIEPEQGGKDIFVHITKLEEKGIRRLVDGQKVSYEPYDDRGRVAAGEIQIL